MGAFNYEQDVELLNDLLVGEFCYGDDGENAEIREVYYDYDENRMCINIRQDDGIEYSGLSLYGFLDSIDADEDTMERVKEILDDYS